MKRCEPIGQHLVNAVHDEIAIAEVGDPDFNARPPDSLNTTFALLEPGRIPGNLDVDDRAEALELAAPSETGAVAVGVEADV